MNYLDRHPQARARAFRLFLLEHLRTNPVIRPYQVARLFEQAEKCTMPNNAAARIAELMVADGRLHKLRQGSYCHSHRQVWTTDKEVAVLQCLDPDRPRPMRDIARALKVSVVLVSHRIRALKELRLVRKRKVEGRPIGYVITELGQEELRQRADIIDPPLKPKPAPAAVQPAYNPFL